MSDYVRIRAVRYKFKDEELAEFQSKAKDEYDYLPDIMLRELNLKEAFDIGKETDYRFHQFTINSGLNFKNYKYEYFLDFLLYYEYGAGGDFEFCRELTEEENEKLLPYFKKKFPNLNIDELRFVDYSYYNGVDEPAIWNTTKIDDTDFMFLGDD